MQRVYNFSPALAYSFAVMGVLLCGNGRTVDLEQLAKHNLIEHDASLSRRDLITCLPFHGYAPMAPDLALVDQLLDQSSDGVYLTLQDFARARILRESAIVGAPLDPLRAELARGETSLILEVLGNDTGRVAKDVLRGWLVDGKLPDGWKRPDKVVGLFRTVLMSRRVAGAMRDLGSEA
jgi:hypothetical protein